MSKALDQVRREEAREQKDLLKRSRYLWLKRPENLNAKQRDRLDVLLQEPLATARAYRWALKFDHFYEIDAPDAEEYLRRWVKGAKRTGLEPLVKFAVMVDEYWLGITRWHHSRVSNRLLERLNSLSQAAKRRARGYRSTRNYTAMIYLVAGKLNAGPQPT